MICVNCGRPITGKFCDYCGTDYRTDEEKKEIECDHIYDSVFYDLSIRHCYGHLIFKCDRCSKETAIKITDRLIRMLNTGGHL